jgi:predicted nucleotidyltransferase
MPTERQQALIAALTGLLDAQPHVQATWLAGSLGRGEGDEFSDVDTLALTADGRAGEVSAALAANLATVATPVLVNRLYGGRVLSVVTEDWDRFDIVLVEAADLARYDARDLKPLFRKAGPAPPTRPEAPYRPDPGQITRLAQEFLRVLGLAPVGFGRGEYDVMLSGVDQLRRMTIELMLEENAVPPARRGGALRRNPLLTEDQRRALAAIPPQSADRASLLAVNAAFVAVFLPRARRLAAQVGAAWPEALEAATRRRLREALGVEI